MLPDSPNANVSNSFTAHTESSAQSSIISRAKCSLDLADVFHRELVPVVIFAPSRLTEVEDRVWVDWMFVPSLPYRVAEIVTHRPTKEVLWLKTSTVIAAMADIGGYTLVQQEEHDLMESNAVSVDECDGLVPAPPPIN